MPPDTPPDGQQTWAPRSPEAEAATEVPEDPDPGPGSPTPIPTDARYQQTGVLGRGGIAEVRSVLDERLGREVAIKRLQRVDSRMGRQRFLREARVTAQLEHPGIVPIYDADVDADGVPFYTMKYVRGTALSVALFEARGLQGRMELLPAFAAVCQAMAYAHDRRVIHRDLKPDNIMLGEFGEALVVDWGLARALDDDGAAADGPSRPVALDDAALTVMGQIAGTPAYMAPEQARGEPTSPATDVFALGAILYELLTGTPPHGVADDIHEQIARARSERIVPVRKRSPYAPPDLATIAERALSFDPHGRYASAAELAQEVERWSTGRLVRAYSYSPLEQARRLVSMYWLPLGLGLAGITAVLVVGAIGITQTRAEAARAQAKEKEATLSAAKANRDLATMLRERAARAIEEDHASDARAFAAASLALQEDPVGRGRLADAWERPGISRLWSFRAPHPCVVLAYDGSHLICAGKGQASKLDAEGAATWTTSLPVETVSKIAWEGGRLWVGTQDGVVLLNAESGAEEAHAPGGFVVAMLPYGDGRLRSSQWSDQERFLVDWTPPYVPVATRYGSSSVMDLHLRDGEEVQLHAAGYLSDTDDEPLGEVQHVAYDMAPLSDGWLIGGSDTTWLRSDGSVVGLEALSGSFGFVQTNDRDQIAGVTADNHVLVYDLPSRGLLADLPTEQVSVRPGLAFADDVLVAAHGDRVRAWHVPRHPGVGGGWKSAQERPDGLARLHCDHAGRAVLHLLDDGEIVDLSIDRPDSLLTACTFLDGDPAATWSGQSVRWDEHGQAHPIESEIAIVTDMVEVAGQLVVEGEGRVMAGAVPLGAGLIGVDADGLVVAQDVETASVRWSRYGPDGWTTVHEQPLENNSSKALATLPGFRVVESQRLGEDAPPQIVGPEGASSMPVHPTKVTAAASLDERWLVTGDQSGTLRLWDLPEGRLIAEVEAHEARVVDIYLTGEGERRRIVSESFDHSIHAWSVELLFTAADQAVDAVRERDGLEVREGTIRHVEIPQRYAPSRPERAR